MPVIQGAVGRPKSENDVHVAVRLPQDTLDRADELRGELLAGVTVTRSDVLRAAIAAGLEVLEEKHGKGKKRRKR